MLGPVNVDQMPVQIIMDGMENFAKLQWVVGMAFGVMARIALENGTQAINGASDVQEN